MKTITLSLDLYTARIVRDCLASRARFYGDKTVGYEHCEALRQFLGEEIEKRRLSTLEKVAGVGVVSSNPERTNV